MQWMGKYMSTNLNEDTARLTQLLFVGKDVKVPRAAKAFMHLKPIDPSCNIKPAAADR